MCLHPLLARGGRGRPGREGPLCPGASDVNLFRYRGAITNIDPEQICCSLLKTLGKHQILVAARVIVDTTDHFKAEFRKSHVLEVVGLQHKLLSSGILAVAKPSLATVMRESRSYAGIASIRLNPVASGSSKVRFNLKLAAASSA